MPHFVGRLNSPSPEKVSILLKSQYGATDVSDATETDVTATDEATPPSEITPMQELCAIVKFAVPAGLSRAAGMVVANTDTVYLGHVGSAQQGAASLAFNITGLFSFLYGGCCFVQTSLVSQAIGAKNPHLAGVWLQITMSVVLAIAIPSAAFFFFGTHYVVSLLSPDPEVADDAMAFNRIYWAYTLLAAVNLTLIQFASGLSENTGALLGTICTVTVNIAFNQIFIYGCYGWSGLGFVGSPLASTCAMACQLLVFAAYSFGWRRIHLETGAWKGLTYSAYRGDRLSTFG